MYRDMPRTIVIGDVHGCLRELEELLAACQYTADDQIIMVGDLVAKGPDSRGVLALLRRVKARAVRGNHDQAVLRWHDAVVQGTAPAHASHHLKVARQLTNEDWQVLTQLPLYLRVPEHGMLVVHAGLVPGVPLEQQSVDLMMNIRTLRPDGTGSRRPEDGELWGTAWLGPELVLFGHHAMAGLQRHPHAIGLDTGCVYGGRLTAYVLPDARFVSVAARQIYAPVDAERRGPA
jgi:diadenosine tetraphosphatase ApaH/serine/threonine PP2A family protein phosphatase